MRISLPTSRNAVRRRFPIMRRFIVLCGIGIVVMAVLFGRTPTALAYSISNTDQILTTTGGGGLVGPVACPTGSVIFELDATGESSISSLTRPVATCANLNASATTRNSNTGTLGDSSWGTSAGNTPLTAVSCASNEALVGVVAHKQTNGYVSGWQLICGTLPSGGSRVTSSTTFGYQNAGTSSPSQRETIQCPTGMVAVGMLAYTGSIMDRIGFRCGTISSADQTTVTVTSASTITYNSTLTLTSSGGLGSGATTYATTGSCSISGTTLTATGNAGTTCSVTATKAGDTNYSSATSAAQTVTIQKAANSISFTNPGTRTWSATTFSVVASATSGDTPTITSTTTSVCTTSGLVVTMVSSGTCTLVASEDGNTNYNAASDVTQSFVINSTGRSGFTGNSGTISGTTTGTKYIVERFTTTGSSSWTVPQGVTGVDLLVVGGGGGGASRHGGGGGAGGVATSNNYSVTPGHVFTVVVGAGGAGGAAVVDSGNVGGNGSESSFLRSGTGVRASGGEGGQRGGTAPVVAGGRSGGINGTAYLNTGGAGVVDACPSGYATWCGGGGAGAGANGSNAVSTGSGSGGAGGTGVSSSITGTANTYGGGGGGGGGAGSGAPSAPGGSGGSGGGAAGGGTNVATGATNCTAGAAGSAAAANTGGGGGAGGYCNNAWGNISGSPAGGAGGSGIVVVRYALPSTTTPDLASASDSGSSSTDNITTNRTLTFTGTAAINATVQLSVATASSTSDTDATTGTWSNSGSTCTADGTSGAWSCTTAQLAPGLYKVRSTATATFDGVTDTQTSTTALVTTIDTTAPTVSISRAGSGTLRSGQTETLTFTISEASPDFVVGDITVSGGTIGSFATTSSSVYTAVFTPTTNTQSGIGSISVAGGLFTDIAGNTNTASSTFSINYDTSAPTISLSGCASSYAAGATCTITVTLSDDVADLVLADFSATRGRLSALTTSGTTRTITFTATGPTGGTGLVSVAANTFTDSTGNNNVASNSLSVSISPSNTRQMLSSLTSSGASVADGTLGASRYIIQTFAATGSTTWTVPQGVSRIDLLVVGGGAGGGSRGAGGGGAGGYVEATNYSVTPGSSYSVVVGAGGAGAASSTMDSGAAGNASSFTVSGVGVTANGGGAGLSHSFNGNGGASGTGSGAGATAYNTSGGSGAASGTCGATSDWCGGGGGGATQAGANAVSSGGKGGNGRASAITGDSTTYAGGGGGGGGDSSNPSNSPSLGGNGGDGGGGAGGSASWDGTYCRAGAGVSGTTNTGGGGGGGAYCNWNNVSGASGNGGGGNGGSGIVVVRYLLPSVTTPDLSTASDSGSSSTDNITTNRTLTFTGTAAVGATVQLSVATASSASDTDATTGTWADSGSTCTADTNTGSWSCTTAQLAPGLYKVRSTATTTIDGVTDTQTTTSALPVTIDTTVPTVTITRAGSGSLKSGQTETLTFTTSEATTDFVVGDITVSGGAIGSFTATSATVYTAVFTPTANTQSGSGSISVAANAFTDTAGNNNTASSTTSITYDTAAPTMTISALPTSVSSGGTSTITFTASETTSTFTRDDITVTLGTLSALSGSGTTYTATFTGSPSTGGTAVITVASGSFSDSATNASTSAFTLNVTVNNTSSSSGGRTSYLANGTNGTNGTRYFVERFTTVGSTTWTAPRGVTSVEYLVIGGGGGGGGSTANAHGGGGGGAGGYRTNAAGQSSGGGASAESAFTVTPGTSYTVVVGAGGSGGAAQAAGVAGGNSQFGSITALGGGRGGAYFSGNGPTSGGSGGGAGVSNALYTGANGTSGQGFKGGNTPTSSIYTTNGAGGGGSGGAGQNGVDNGPVAAGGVGTTSTITGSSVTRAAGGSGGLGNVSTAGTAATANTGDGGGGGSAVGGVTSTGGSGGSGIVVVRYAVPDVSTPDLDATDDTGVSTDNITSATTLTFTGSAPVGSTVQLLVDGVASGNTCVADSVTGLWSCDTGVLTEGDKVVTAQSTTILSDSTVTSTSTGLTVTVDTTAPTVSSVSFTSNAGSDNTYKTGDTISVTVAFSENVTVTGSPRIALAGLTSKFATYASGSGTSSLVFTYTVASGDSDTDGLSIDTNSLTLNSGTIRDTAANNATLTHSAVTTQSAHTVDGVSPTVTITRAGSGTLKSGQTETLTFTLSEASADFAVGDITVSGGTLDTFASTSSTVYTAVFTPTANTQSGTGSISVTSAKFTDPAGNTNAASSTTSISYDTQSPNVSNVTSSTANGTVGIGSSISIQVVFSETVNVTGTPQLTLETGSTNRIASYSSGTGTSTLTFNYTVQSGDTSSDLDYASTTALSLNGGTIADGTGNSAGLTLPTPGTSGSLAANKAIVVASEPTQIVSVRSPLGTASGAAFTTQPQVSLRDSGGSVVTSDNSTVVTASVSSGATLVGTRTASAVNGVATFSDLGISGTAGTAYTITYTATVSGNTLTPATQTVTPTVGSATQLSITTQPVGDTAGALLATQPSIDILDSGNNIVTSSSAAVTVTASSGNLSGTRTLNAVNGSVSFTDLVFAGTSSTNYTLTFASPNLGTTTSNAFTVGVGAATKLVLITNASGAVYNQSFSAQPVVEIRDAGDNKVSTATNQVTATLSSGTVVGTSNSSLSINASGGTATFAGLGITGTPGTFTITYSSGSLTGTSQTISLIKANQSITFATPADRAWSATPFSLAPTASSGLTVSLTSTSPSICSVSGFDVTMVTVGTCSLTAAQAGNDFYNAATSISRSFEISQASQSISFAVISDRSWSANTFDVSPTSTSGLSVSVTSTTTAVCTVSGTTISMLKAGTCTLSATQVGNTKYLAATSQTQSFEISLATQASLSITTTTATFESNLTLSTSGGSGTGAVTFTFVSGDCTVSGTTLTPTAAGSCVITATKAADTQYASATDTQTITINKANQSTPLALTSTSVVYGQTLTLNASGGNGPGSISYSVDAGTCTLNGATLTPGDAGSVCDVRVTRANSNNYNSLTSSPITIAVIAKPITVTAVAKQKTYGDTDPTLTYTTANGALVGSDTLTGTPTRVSGENVGEYTINQGTVANSNYDITFTTAKLTINAKPITVTAVAKQKTYGDTDPTLTYTTANGALVGSDTLTGTPTRVSGENVGEYTINQGTVANSNYDITFTTAKLTINAKPITVTAVAKQKTYGDTDPTLTYTTANGALVGSDTLAGSLTRDPGEDANTYTIRRGTLANSNYDITFITSSLTIVQAQQSTLTVSTTSVTYRTPIALVATGGTEGDLSFAVTSTGTAGCSIADDMLTATGNAGTTCTVTATRAATNNYLQKTSAPVTITVAPRAITVTATAKEKTYGESDPAFTYVITSGSLYGTDTLSGAQTRTTGENVGTYSINKGTLSNANYTITYVPAELTIVQRPITITAANKTKIFGENDPALTYTITTGNLVNSDSLTGAITRAPGETLGTYNITRGTLNNGNYNITFVVGTFQITGAQQAGFTLSASSNSVIYQQTITLQTSGGNGFGAVSYTASNGTGSCSIVGTTLTGDAAGTCTVVATKAAEGGYLEATSSPITITVDKADQTIALAQIADHDFAPSPITVAPTSTSGSTVLVTSQTPNVCEVNTFDVQMKDSGTCTLAASVSESRNYNAAPTITRSFTIRAVTPFAPTITSVEAGDAIVTVNFTAGLSGGAAITTYRYSVDDGVQWKELPEGTISSPITLTNLPNDIEAKIRIRAVNRIGVGVRSNMKAATPVAKRSVVWEIERKSNSSLTTTEPVVSALVNQLPPRPAVVRTKSVLGGRRTQVTATRASKDAAIPVTHAIISVRLKNGKLLARIQVQVDPNNPTTSVTVPYQSSRVNITVQFANHIGVSAGGSAGINLREGNTFLGTTIDGRPRLAGTLVPGGVSFAKGSSSLTSAEKTKLRNTLRVVQARGGWIYVTGYASNGELSSAWNLESLARKRAETVAKYLISIGARQWITFYGAPTTPTAWHTSRPGHVDIATLSPDQI